MTPKLNLTKRIREATSRIPKDRIEEAEEKEIKINGGKKNLHCQKTLC